MTNTAKVLCVWCVLIWPFLLPVVWPKIRKAKKQKEEDYEIRFEAVQYQGSYPPISVNLTFYVNVARDGVPLLFCHVIPMKHRYSYFVDRLNNDKNYKMWVVACDRSEMTPLFHSGDTICIDNNKKAAFAKAEILSERIDYKHHHMLADSITRKLRLTKELGHPETLAFETGYPAEVATYVADESTEEYFGGKDTLEKDIKVYFISEPVEQDGRVWYEYTHEDVSYNSPIQLTTPFTEAEMTMQLKKKVLEELHDVCPGFPKWRVHWHRHRLAWQRRPAT